jgi:hypothetical protein
MRPIGVKRRPVGGSPTPGYADSHARGPLRTKRGGIAYFMPCPGGSEAVMGVGQRQFGVTMGSWNLPPRRQCSATAWISWSNFLVFSPRASRSLRVPQC